MRHYSPDEFMSEGRRNALALAERIETAGHFNMRYWTKPGMELCPSCLAGHIAAHVLGRQELRRMGGAELMDFGAAWLGLTETQAREAFTPDYVLGGGITDSRHRPDDVARAVAMLRHYAQTGDVIWRPLGASAVAPVLASPLASALAW